MNWYMAFICMIAGSQFASCTTNQEQNVKIKELQQQVLELKEKSVENP